MGNFGGINLIYYRGFDLISNQPTIHLLCALEIIPVQIGVGFLVSCSQISVQMVMHVFKVILLRLIFRLISG